MTERKIKGESEKKMINIALYLKYREVPGKSIPFDESSILKGFKIDNKPFGNKPEDKAEEQYDIKKTIEPLKSVPFFQFEYAYMRNPEEPNILGIVFRHQLLHFNGRKHFQFLVDKDAFGGLESWEVVKQEY